jgi:hypothetical protein
VLVVPGTKIAINPLRDETLGLGVGQVNTVVDPDASTQTVVFPAPAGPVDPCVPVFPAMLRFQSVWAPLPPVPLQVLAVALVVAVNVKDVPLYSVIGPIIYALGVPFDVTCRQDPTW